MGEGLVNETGLLHPRSGKIDRGNGAAVSMDCRPPHYGRMIVANLSPLTGRG
ncbi:hypothetical protein J2X73_002101 [Novosphingobium sp. 1748]|nr:hypothetical protein [Novosphingobium sp. 1748]